jgi:hemolysin III
MALFGISALYHRINWRTLSARRRMRQLDHSMIFVLIAGSYTPFAMLALHGPLSTAILVAVWAGALAGVVLSLAWIGAPKWLWAMLYVGLGWILLAAMPELAAAVGIGGLTLVALGGVLYTLGAVVYSLQRPDPAPAVFGYHEVFHALVIIAAALQFAVIAFWVLPG